MLASWRGAAFSIRQLMNGGAADLANVETQQQLQPSPYSHDYPRNHPGYHLFGAPAVSLHRF